jgi:hypothetical protein
MGCVNIYPLFFVETCYFEGLNAALLQRAARADLPGRSRRAASMGLLLATASEEQDALDVSMESSMGKWIYKRASAAVF